MVEVSGGELDLKQLARTKLRHGSPSDMLGTTPVGGGERLGQRPGASEAKALTAEPLPALGTKQLCTSVAAGAAAPKARWQQRRCTMPTAPAHCTLGASSSATRLLPTRPVCCAGAPIWKHYDSLHFPYLSLHVPAVAQLLVLNV